MHKKVANKGSEKPTKHEKSWKRTHLLEIGRREIVGQRKLRRLRGGVRSERAEPSPVVLLGIAHRARLESTERDECSRDWISVDSFSSLGLTPNY